MREREAGLQTTADMHSILFCRRHRPTGTEWFPAFRIPLTAVAKSYSQGNNKREAIIEFSRDEQAEDKTPQLDSMRLHFTTKGNEDEAGANSHAENIIQDIMSHVQDDIISEDAIFKFDGDYTLMCLNLSRAKYAFHMYVEKNYLCIINVLDDADQNAGERGVSVSSQDGTLLQFCTC